MASSLPGSNQWIHATSAWDKWEHFSAYGLLGLTMSLALPLSKVLKEKSYAWIFWWMFLGPVLACLDEWHQSFVPGRMADVWDVMADVSGYLLVLLVVLQMRMWRARSAQA